MKHPTRWLYLVFLALILIGLTRLHFDVQVLNILPPDLPVVRGLKLYQEHFANARELLLAIRAPDADQAEAAAREIALALRQATNLVSQVTWQPPWREHPEQAAEFVGFLWLNQPPAAFHQLTNQLAPEKVAAQFELAREQLTTSLSPEQIALLSYDPLGLSRLPLSNSAVSPSFADGQGPFSSSDGAFRVIFVQGGRELSNYRECLKWLGEIKREVGNALAANHFASVVKVGYTGAPVFVAEISSGMESDISKSVGSTVIIIILLFWWAHRRFGPLLWLLTLLAVVLAATLAIGGLIFGALSVVSVGFAAILLGLAVDYGLVLYQESLHAPDLSPSELRRILSPSIVWSAVTTAGAFLILNLGGLPGLAQLGTLVGIGVSLAAIVMLRFFLRPLRKQGARSGEQRAENKKLWNDKIAWGCTLLVLVFAAVMLPRAHPALDHTADSLRPRHSQAYDTMREITQEIGRGQEPQWLVVSAPDEPAMVHKLEQIEPILQRAVSNQQISSFNLPTPLFPRPDYQIQNGGFARQFIEQVSMIRRIAEGNGFSSNSLAFTEAIFQTWQNASHTSKVFWPTGEVSQWTLNKFIARETNGFYALGLLSEEKHASSLTDELAHQDAWLASWDDLGRALLEVVKSRFWPVMAPMTILLLASLWLAFRSWREMLLSVATLLFSGLCLWCLMGVAGWSWNLLNLMALPLLLGAGVDYSIHMQLGLRRHGGDVAATRRTIGRALFLCAATTVAGFGSNAWSSNGGLVSLGKVCAAGIAFAYLTSAFLLPSWWKWWTAAAKIPRTSRNETSSVR